MCAQHYQELVCCRREFGIANVDGGNRPSHLARQERNDDAGMAMVRRSLAPRTLMPRFVAGVPRVTGDRRER